MSAKKLQCAGYALLALGQCIIMENVSAKYGADTPSYGSTDTYDYTAGTTGSPLYSGASTTSYGSGEQYGSWPAAGSVSFPATQAGDVSSPYGSYNTAQPTCSDRPGQAGYFPQSNGYANNSSNYSGNAYCGDYRSANDRRSGKKQWQHDKSAGGKQGKFGDKRGGGKFGSGGQFNGNYGNGNYSSGGANNSSQDQWPTTTHSNGFGGNSGANAFGNYGGNSGGGSNNSGYGSCRQ